MCLVLTFVKIGQLPRNLRVVLGYRVLLCAFKTVVILCTVFIRGHVKNFNIVSSYLQCLKMNDVDNSKDLSKNKISKPN